MCQSMMSMTVGVFYCLLPHLVHSDPVLVAQYQEWLVGVCLGVAMQPLARVNSMLD